MAPRWHNFREKLISSDVVNETNGRLVFQRDHLFNSPSAAETAVMARQANGWTEWVDESGRTLDEVVRQQDEA